MESPIGSGLLETFDGSVHSLAGGGEGAGGQHFDLLCVLDFGTSVDNFLPSFLKFSSEVSELYHLSFDEGVSQLLYCLIDDGLVGLPGLEDVLTKGMERGLHTITRSCS